MIVIIDYGMGNLRSVSKALELLGADVTITSDASVIHEADKIVLPGVGAFKDAMSELNRLSLSDAIRNETNDGKPLLGICLGLQLLFESSEENPGVEGLGVLKGAVKRFQSTDVKVPHMGWNEVLVNSDHEFVDDVVNPSYYYFVHSYYAVPEDSAVIIGNCEYGDDQVTSIVAKDNIVATQFHPEKSQDAGLHLLKNFVERVS